MKSHAKSSPLGPGVPATLAALVIALDEAGVMSKERYRDTLQRLWSEMPETDDFEVEALSCHHLFEYLADRDPDDRAI